MFHLFWFVLVLQHNKEVTFFSTSKILDVGLPISHKFGWHEKIWKYYLLVNTLNTRNGYNNNVSNDQLFSNV